MLIEKGTALIVVAQIAILRPIREGAPRMPHVLSMVLANGFGGVLAVFDSGPKEAMVPPGVIYFDGRRTSAIDMRRAILERLGNNNVLVGFHVVWTLTALSLPLPASRGRPRRRRGLPAVLLQGRVVIHSVDTLR